MYKHHSIRKAVKLKDTMSFHCFENMKLKESEHCPAPVRFFRNVSRISTGK